MTNVCQGYHKNKKMIYFLRYGVVGLVVIEVGGGV